MINVLIVEDSEVAATLLVGTLRRWGYAAAVAESVDQAVELLAAAQYDLVVLDLHLPVTAGAATIEAMCAATRLPIIVWSGDLEQGLIHAIAQWPQVLAVVGKIGDPASVAALVQFHLERRT